MLGMRARRGESRRHRGRWAARGLAVVVAAVVLLAVLDTTFLDLPDWFGGGESDPAPRGSVTYEGQEARTASERFLVDVGDGEAVVAVEAKQDWDTPGWLVDGDLQPTNGTSSVSDPAARGNPARLRVAVDYCADGTLATTRADADGRVLALDVDLGSLVVCDTTLEHTPGNDAAFRQDDTPASFHGDFVSFVARAAEVTAAASACPRDELRRFLGDDYRAFVARQLAARYRVPAEDVRVTGGTIGSSDEGTRRSLRQALERVAARRDPDDPDVRYDALTVQYLAGDGEAVTDSCYLDTGGRDLDRLGAGAAR